QCRNERKLVVRAGEMQRPPGLPAVEVVQGQHVVQKLDEGAVAESGERLDGSAPERAVRRRRRASDNWARLADAKRSERADRCFAYSGVGGVVYVSNQLFLAGAPCIPRCPYCEHAGGC